MRLTRTMTPLIALTALGLVGCTNMNDSQQSTLSGAAIGAGVGAAGTIITGGCVSCGTAIGAGVGAAAGYIKEEMDNQ